MRSSLPLLGDLSGLRPNVSAQAFFFRSKIVVSESRRVFCHSSLNVLARQEKLPKREQALAYSSRKESSRLMVEKSGHRVSLEKEVHSFSHCRWRNSNLRKKLHDFGVLFYPIPTFQSDLIRTRGKRHSNERRQTKLLLR